MEELFERFPHLSESIFFKLNYESLGTCREVSRTWNEATKVKRNLWWKVIKGYTECSDVLLIEMVEKCGAPILLVSILNKVQGIPA